MTSPVIDGKRALLEEMQEFCDKNLSAFDFIIQAAEERKRKYAAKWHKLILTDVPKPLKSGKFKQSGRLKRFQELVGYTAGVLLPVYLEQKNSLDWTSGLPRFILGCGDSGVLLLNEVEKTLKGFDIFLSTVDSKMFYWYAEIESLSRPCCYVRH